MHSGRRLTCPCPIYFRPLLRMFLLQVSNSAPPSKACPGLAKYLGRDLVPEQKTNRISLVEIERYHESRHVLSGIPHHLPRSFLNSDLSVRGWDTTIPIPVRGFFTSIPFLSESGRDFRRPVLATREESRPQVEYWITSPTFPSI